MVQHVVVCTNEHIEPAHVPCCSSRVSWELRIAVQVFPEVPPDTVPPPVPQRAVVSADEYIEAIGVTGRDSGVTWESIISQPFPEVPTDTVPPPVIQHAIVSADEYIEAIGATGSDSRVTWERKISQV